MITSTSYGPYPQDRQVTRSLAIGIAVLVLAGFVWRNSADQLIAYLVVLAAAVLPSTLWIRLGSRGIPIYPIVALVYIPYFARPILTDRDLILNYSESEITRASLTVALFLLAATVTWRLMAGNAYSQRHITSNEVDASKAVQLALAGLAVGIIFHIAVISGSLAWLGSFYGLVRIIAITFVTVALFLAGVSRAQGILRGKAWGVLIIGVALLVILSWSSLFLVGGMIYMLAMLFGYVIVSKRVPWLIVALALATVTVLHAGKAEMREKYWLHNTNYGGVTSVTQLPALAVEWVAYGITAIATDSVGQSVIERASLLQMILRAQRETPARIDYLHGETYALLPAILVPRFIDSDKPASQIGMDLLNRRYGLLGFNEESVTAIGWGLVAEAYANFGYFGVIGMAFLVGAFCGRLENWSKTAAIISLPTLLSMAVTMTMINVEADFIQLCSTLSQAFAAVLIFLSVFRVFVVRRNPSTRNSSW
ncbi:MAG: hypothetical protein IH604_03765 [Burkholderiales bacterium]|nr:hypothetical protein [Burkholderiales bacterium]